jgi:hypothetical protein
MFMQIQEGQWQGLVINLAHVVYIEPKTQTLVFGQEDPTRGSVTLTMDDGDWSRLKWAFENLKLPAVGKIDLDLSES